MIKIYNTLTKKKETFKPINEEQVLMYSCGPTVYDYAHIGNLSTYLMADFLRRFLEFKGYEVKMIKNITDVGHLTSEGIDKMQKGALREKKTPEEIAAYFTKVFKEDEKKLNILEPDTWTIASKHVKEIIAMVETLIDKGYAYEVDGDVYYDVSKFKKYGKLSGNTLDKLLEGARVEVSKKKKNPHDFNLWRKVDDEKLMKWSSPWGDGIPGWHAECSAMSLKHLGETIDIHTGGEDNIFPHHEDEIAQSEAYTGKEFVKYWVHRRLILVGGRKMAKSDKNFYTLNDLEEEGFDPLIFRALVFGSHYRENLNFSFKGLQNTRKGLDRILDLISRLEEVKREGNGFNAENFTQKYRDKFNESMEDDLNTPEALATIFEFVRACNKYLDLGDIGIDDARVCKEFLEEIDKVTAFIFDYKTKTRDQKIPREVVKLAKERQKAKDNKNYSKADELRDKIYGLGYIIEDSEGKYKLVKI